MTNKTRKHNWPLLLVMSLGIIGVMAVFVVLANNPGATQAHGGVVDHDAECEGYTAAERDAHDGRADAFREDPCPALSAITPTTPDDPRPRWYG